MYSIMSIQLYFFFFFSSRRRHTRCSRDWSSDVCSSDLGRKPGVRYGRKGHRPIPPIVDEEIKVPLPERSPCCGGAIESRHVEDQYQTEIVRQTRVTCFHIQVGNCAKCGKRIQGRDSRQTSDALGAAASQVGPEALSLATILNKELGIPLGKTTASEGSRSP